MSIMKLKIYTLPSIYSLKCFNEYIEIEYVYAVHIKQKGKQICCTVTIHNYYIRNCHNLVNEFHTLIKSRHCVTFLRPCNGFPTFNQMNINTFKNKILIFFPPNFSISKNLWRPCL